VKRSLRSLPPLACAAVVAGLCACRPAPPPPAAAPVAAPAPVDAGLSDEEVFAASMARLAEAKRRAEVEAVALAADASVARPAVPVDAGSALAVLEAAGDAGLVPGVRAELERLARLLLDEEYAPAVERVHELFRSRSPAAAPALEILASTAQDRARIGRLDAIESILPRMQELPTSEASVRGPVARLLGTVALASARAGNPERSRLEARAALALEETTPEAYLALGEYEFQDNDLQGALTTWERGLRLNPNDAALARRLERGRAEAQRLAGLDRVASAHFVVAFDGRADVPAARASLEVMESAYRAVGQLFDSFPDGPIPIVLYPERTFDKEGHASWSAAVYDGKVRLPSAGADANSLAFRGTLFHEYAHALFHRATAGRGAPTWLNEGLAEVARRRADSAPALLCRLDTHSFPLRSLEGSFQGLDSRTARFAYLEARHAVERLIERHGEPGLRRLLSEVSKGGPFALAYERALGEEYATFAAKFDAEAPRTESTQR